MFASVIRNVSSAHYRIPIKEVQRKVHISIVGAASEIGSKVALFLKQNKNITSLKLYDDNETVKGYAIELNHLPGGPNVIPFSGERALPQALTFSDLILMVQRTPRRPGNSRTEMLEINAKSVKKVCKAIVESNPNALFAISTNPINSIVPLACTLLNKYNRFNPLKTFGITEIDVARTKSFASTTLDLDPKALQIPVIGGHSDETIVPLFSNLMPTYYRLDDYQCNALTFLVQKAGSEVLQFKNGDTATLALAWSINEFVCGIVEALRGAKVDLHCYCSNAHFGTSYFAGPTTFGPRGIVLKCTAFSTSEYENQLLKRAILALNRDIQLGEMCANGLYA